MYLIHNMYTMQYQLQGARAKAILPKYQRSISTQSISQVSL